MTADEIQLVIALTGLSGRDFGRVLGVSEMQVNRWEQGKSKPRKGQEEAMAAIRASIVGMPEETFKRYKLSLYEPADVRFKPEYAEDAERLIGELVTVERLDPVDYLRAVVQGADDAHEA